MAGPINSANKKPKRSALSFLVWWSPDPEEVQKQIDQYGTLKLWQSARGISALLCGFSVAITVLLGTQLFELSSGTVLLEALIWGSLAVFMYRGHRWAFLVGMALWTLEKGMMLVQGAAAGHASVMQLFWWAIYMGAFYLAFSVERRRVASGLPTSKADTVSGTAPRAS